MAAFMGLILIGCNVERNNSSIESEESWEGIITLWDFPRWPDKTGNKFGWIESKIREFEKENPGVFIHLRPLKWEYGLIELRAATAAGTYPDIAPIAADFDFIIEGHLEPVNEFISSDELERYEPRAIEAVTYQNQIYGFPWFMTTYGLFLNKDNFTSQNAVIPEDGCWTYDEFVQALQKLTLDQNKDGKIDKYCFNFFLSPSNYQIWGFLTMDGAPVFDKQGNFIEDGMLSWDGIYLIAPRGTSTEPESLMGEELRAYWAGYDYRYIDLENTDLLVVKKRCASWYSRL